MNDLDPVYLARLAACAHMRTFETSEFLFRQGAIANDLYLICSGNVSLEISIPHQGSVQIEALRGGDVIVWSWSIPYQRWQFDARAITSVLAIQIEGKTLLESMEHDHDLGYQVLKRVTPVIAHRLQAVRGRVYQLCSLAARVGCS